MLRYAEIEPYQLTDEGHWFTQRQVNRFHDKLQELSNNPNIDREAGNYSASTEAHGMLRLYLLSIMEPANAYKLIGKFAARLTLSTVYTTKRIGRSKIEIIVTPNKGVTEAPYQCENRIGTLEAMTTVFNYKLPTIDHPECIFKGGTCCRYIISWRETHHIFWKKINIIALCILPLIGLLLYPYLPATTFNTFLFTSIAIFSCLYYYSNKLEKIDLKRAIDSLRETSEAALEEATRNHNNALMANEIGQALSRASGNALDLDTILQEIAIVLGKRLDYDQGIILLADPKQEKLVFRAGFGFDHQLAKQIQEAEFSLDNPNSRGMFVISYWEKKPFLVNNIDEVSKDISPKSLTFAKKIGVTSFICCPIIYEDQAIGVLAVHNTTTHAPLIQRDINLLMGVTPQIGITINNIKLMEAKLRQFQSTLQALAASTDARDPITAGHSLKVTEYVIGICEELKLSKSYTEMIRVAALLHDYGKIGVNDSSLKKPGRLTDIEYTEIKTHAQKTRDILSQIHFEGIYEQVPDIAGSHHEKIDGTGYPMSLKGDQIPFGAKILAVADVYEAVTAKRHYRDPMTHEQAAKILTDGIGTHFDQDCVRALFKWLNKQTQATDNSTHN